MTAVGVSSCEESDNTWDPYYNWKTRNAEWYERVADTARTAIAQARHLYGEEWEKHCEWRMYRNLMRSPEGDATLADSICCRIVQRGTGTESPMGTDTVSVSFRGWIMETEYEQEDGSLQKQMAIFTQTYYGEYNSQTAPPQEMAISALTKGFSTALQYMVEGDDWLVYIPNELAYKGEASTAVPAYSTLLFRIHLTDIKE